MKIKPEHLTLKWGSLKSWNVNSSEGIALLQQWENLGVSASAMMSHDTPEQKEILCKLVDVMDIESVYLAWDDKEVTKDEAKKYIMEYK